MGYASYSAAQSLYLKNATRLSTGQHHIHLTHLLKFVYATVPITPAY